LLRIAANPSAGNHRPIIGKATMQIRRWHHFTDSSTLQEAVAHHISTCAAAAITARGIFHCVLAGGRTPEAIYHRLRALDTDWHAWSIYFGDERCLPPGNSQRNDTMARAAWLDHVSIPSIRIHAIPAELGPVAGARQYAGLLASVPEFDLVLLGLGEDGHTASLFPDDATVLSATDPAIPIDKAPKPPPQRISMSAARLAHSREVLFAVTGADKREALQRWRQGLPIPAASITAPKGVDIYTDQSLS
jgi:6-phosphogluconolactonase